MNTIGDVLRAAREAQGRSIEDASRATRIRGEYLVALEEEQFAAIGGDVFAKGFMSSYARYLGLDPTPMLERYRREIDTTGYDARLLDRPGALRQRGGVPSWLVWGFATAVLLFATLGIASALGGRTPAPAADPPVVAAPRPSGSPAAPPPPPVTPEATPTPTYAGAHLVILVEQDCWIDLLADGAPLFNARTFRSAEVVTADASSEIVLTLGNAGGVRLELNGRALGVPGQPGEVIRGGRCTPDGCDFVAAAA